MAAAAMFPTEGARETARGLVTAYLSWADEIGTKGYGGRAGDAMAGAFDDELAAAAGDPVVMLALVRYAALLCNLAAADDVGGLVLWRTIVRAENADEAGEL